MTYRKKLDEIRERIQKSRIRTERKAEVIRLLDELSAELETIPAESRDKADRIAELADKSVQETENYPLKEMEHSIREFEVNYPVATRIVNRICMMFANLGV